MRAFPAYLSIGILTALPSGVSGQEEPKPPINCGWSTTMKELRAALPPVLARGEFTKPKKKSGSIDRPDSRVPRTIDGVWSLEVVIDAKGAVRDAKIIQAPTVEPPWPEYEEAILRSVRSWKYSPLLLGKQPLPACLTLTVSDRE